MYKSKYVEKVVFEKQPVVSKKRMFSSEKLFYATVVLNKQAILNSMKPWLESFKEMKTCYFTIDRGKVEKIDGAYSYVPDRIYFQPDLLESIEFEDVAEETIDKAAKEMQANWDSLVGETIRVEVSVTPEEYNVYFDEIEEKMTQGIDQEKIRLDEVPESILLDIGFFLDSVEPDIKKTVLQRVNQLKKDMDIER